MLIRWANSSRSASWRMPAAQPLAQFALVGRGQLLEDNFLHSIEKPQETRLPPKMHREGERNRRFLPPSAFPNRLLGSSASAPRSSRSRLTTGRRLPRRRKIGVPWMSSMPRCAWSPSNRTSSSKLTCGMANRSRRALTISAGMIASVSGILILKVVPWPAVLCTSIRAADLLDAGLDHVQADVASRGLGDLLGSREAGKKDQLTQFVVAHSRADRGKSSRVPPRGESVRWMSMPAPSSAISILTCPLS